MASPLFTVYSPPSPATITATTLPTTMTRTVPPRKVRFAAEPQYRDAPSPSYSSSTLSSPGPRTPQQLYQSLVPIYARHPSSNSSPSMSPRALAYSLPPGAVKIHDCLGLPYHPVFEFDTSLDPAKNPHMYNNRELQKFLHEPATTPPLACLTLVSRHLPWEILILPSADQSNAFVTVADVLGGLYRALRLPISAEEFNRETEERRNAIASAFYKRYERHAPDYESMIQEQSKGVKRIDFLTGVHRFCGLSKTERPNVWRLSFQ